MKENNQTPKLRLRIGSALSTLALIISICLCLSVAVQTYTNGYVQFGGFSLFRVVTGSMEPTLPVGSLLICQQTPIEEIREGDIICFRSRSPEMMGKIITHRVITVLTGGDGSPLLETKGDANLSADGEFVTVKNLIGKVNHYAKDGNLMATLVNVLTDKIGFMMLILFPTLLIAGFILRACMSNMQRDIEKVLEEEKRQKNYLDKSNLYTQEEYAAMLDRLKGEILEEMKQGVEEHDEETTATSKTE